MTRLAIPALLLFLLASCGGAPRVARVVVLEAAEAVHAVDEASAAHYTAAAERALERATTLLEYRNAMAPWDGLVTAAQLTESALRMAEATLDTWDAGGSERWLNAAGCLGSALAELVRAIELCGLEIPPDVAEAITVVSAVSANLCEGS